MDQGAAFPSFGNDNNLNTFFEASYGTWIHHFFRIDMQAPRKVVNIVFTIV